MMRQYLPLKKNFTLPIILGIALSIIALVLSAILVCKHSGICVSSMGCSIDGVDGCAELAKSHYSKFHIPLTTSSIPIAWLGFFYYGFVLLLFTLLTAQATLQKKTSILILLASTVILGFIFDVFLAYRNFYKLVTPCLLCTYTYLCQLGIVAIGLWLYFSSQEQQKSFRQKRTPLDWLKSIMPHFALSFGGTTFITLLLLVSLWLSKPSISSKENIGDLLPLQQVSQILREFNALKAVDVSTEGLTSLTGGGNAYIQIHEWLDFRCPHCRLASKLLKTVSQRWPGRINIYYRHFPLDATCNPHMKRKQPDAASCKAAQASICATKQGYFPQFVQSLFSFQTSRTPITEQSLQGLISNLGGNWAEVRRCMASAATKTIILRDANEANEIKITGTPTLVVNNRLLPSGSPHQAWLTRVLDALVLEKEGEAAIEEYRTRLR